MVFQYGKEAKTRVALASSRLFVSRSERFRKPVDRCRSIESGKNQNQTNAGYVGISMIIVYFSNVSHHFIDLSTPRIIGPDAGDYGPQFGRVCRT